MENVNRTLLDFVQEASTSKEGIVDDDAGREIEILSDNFITPGPLTLNFTVHEEYDNSTSTETSFFPSPDEVMDFIETNHAILFLVIGIAVILVLMIVVSICCWIVKHKKRVIERREEPIIADFEDGFEWPRWMFCCPRRLPKHVDLMRQNSASNMDPYRRPPLPPIPGTENKDGYYGSYLPPRRQILEPIQRTPSNPPEQTRIDPDDPLLGIHIMGIKGIPSVPVPNNQHRPLPPLAKY